MGLGILAGLGIAGYLLGVGLTAFLLSLAGAFSTFGGGLWALLLVLFWPITIPATFLSNWE